MKKTPLYGFHEKHKARFGTFSGYEMPLFYEAGIIREHLHTRENASLFDISHMMMVEFSGNDVVQTIARLCPLKAQEMRIGDARYTFFLNERGGVIDDLIVTRLAEDRFVMVCNAGCAEKDWSHINRHIPDYVVRANRMAYGIIAVQGPRAQAILETGGLLSCSELKFMQAVEVDNNGNDRWIVSRGGYTGEDGFEIAMPENQLVPYVEKIMTDDYLSPAGLGARDSLRLEAGLSLYGQDLSENISPMEAGLTWAIPKELRVGGSYIGADSIAQKITTGKRRKRVGLKPQDRMPVRAGSIILGRTGERAGEVTSGGFGPSVGHPVAMGLIDVEADRDGLTAQVRSKRIPLSVVSLPFVTHNYKYKS